MWCCSPDNAKGMGGMMQECMKRCRWCPLIPMIFGIVFFLIGYFLPAETIKMLWLVFSGFAVLMGTICLIMMNVMFKG